MITPPMFLGLIFITPPGGAAGPLGIGRACFAGGWVSGANSNIIDYITVASTGNAIDFGDLTVARTYVGGSASDTRGVFGGGQGDAVTIDYVTVASAGNATDFGDHAATGNGRSTASGGSLTRCVFSCEWASNIIEFITIASAGNATDFGNQTHSSQELGAGGDSTRLAFGGGNANIIDYVTIASAGNATDFGDLNNSVNENGGCDNSTRVTFFGGGSLNVIDYVTTQTTGNATDFGDLQAAKNLVGGAGAMDRGVCVGGYSSVDVIGYWDLTSPGNATDFGNLTIAGYGHSGFSDQHGGLQ